MSADAIVALEAVLQFLRMGHVDVAEEYVESAIATYKSALTLAQIAKQQRERDRGAQRGRDWRLRQKTRAAAPARSPRATPSSSAPATSNGQDPDEPQ